MARPTAAQRQAQAVLDAREKPARKREEQAHSPGLSTLTGAPGRSVSLATGGHAYDRLLTVDQVSDWLGVPKGTLYQ